MNKHRHANLRDTNGTPILYEDIGRPIENDSRLDDLKGKVGKLASINSCILSFKKNPNVVYALGSEIKMVRQKGGVYVANTSTSNQVLSNMIEAQLFPNLLLDIGLSAEISDVTYKQLKNGNRKDLRLKLKDVPNFDNQGSVLYEERHAIQYHLGLLRPRFNHESSDNSKAIKPRPVTLLLGIFEGPNPISESRFVESLATSLIGKTVHLAKISTFDAFSNQSDKR